MKRTELLEKVWGYQDDSSEGGRVIDVHIGQIRKKLNLTLKILLLFKRLEVLAIVSINRGDY